LLDETSLFLHRVIGNLPEHKQRMLATLYDSDEALAGKKVLVVDDDARNIFALSSVLERRKMQVVSASNGRDAIGLIEKMPELSLVLMDSRMGRGVKREVLNDDRLVERCVELHTPLSLIPSPSRGDGSQSRHAPTRARSV